jgi:hypothetical protein
MSLDMPPEIDSAWVESAIERTESERNLELTLTRLSEADLLGEGRLLQWLAFAKHESRPISLRLNQDLPPIEEEPQHKVWISARDSLATLILVEHAERILDRDGNDRREDLVDVALGNLRAKGGQVGFGRERSIVSLDRPQAPRAFHPFREKSEQFTQVRIALRELGRVLQLQGIGETGLEAATTFAGEVIENTREHAREDLSGRRIEGMRFVQLRRHQITRQRGMARLPVREGRLRDYLNRVSETDELGEENVAQFAELTVADSGVGIPARLLGSEDVYSGPIAAETELTLRAMRPDESSQPKSVPGRGQGLKNALDAAAELRGIVVIRAGRLSLTRDTTEAAPRGQDGWHIDEAPLIRGTAVSMLLPWWPLSQQDRIASQRR